MSTNVPNISTQHDISQYDLKIKIKKKKNLKNATNIT